MIIRNAKPEDAAALLDIYTPYITDTIITFETEIPSVEEFQDRIAEVQEKFPYLVAEEDGEILGYAYAHPYYGRSAYAWTAELSIYIRQEARHAGLGTKLYDKLEKQLEAQNVLNFLACISVPNDASIAFHEKRGYELIGQFKKVGYKFKAWHDTVWMEKHLRDVAFPEPVIYKQS